MSDEHDESARLGAADPITGVTDAKDDLAPVLPDDDEAVDPEALAEESMQTVTTDGVAGETVLPGLGEGNDGPTGGAPGEITPIEPENELDPADIDLDDQR